MTKQEPPPSCRGVNPDVGNSIGEPWSSDVSVVKCAKSQNTHEVDKSVNTFGSNLLEYQPQSRPPPEVGGCEQGGPKLTYCDAKPAGALKQCGGLKIIVLLGMITFIFELHYLFPVGREEELLISRGRELLPIRSSPRPALRYDGKDCFTGRRTPTSKSVAARKQGDGSTIGT